jgi:hypothetical protein
MSLGTGYLRIGRTGLAAPLVVALVAAERAALAFGGSAPELPRQGNFVVSNDASFAFDQQIGHGGGTAFVLRPSLDYFVIPNLSLGGAVMFEAFSTPGAPTSTVVGFEPRVGYDVALSGTWSIWPQLSLPITVPHPGNTAVAIAIFVPFLIHPAQHFFFGIGPGFSQTVTSPAATAITGGFTIGGYFDR